MAGLRHTQTQAVIRMEGYHLEKSTRTAGEISELIHHRKGGRVLEKARPCVFDPTLFGTPQVEERLILPLGQPGVFVRVEEPTGQPAGFRIRAVELKVQTEGLGAKGTHPPASAVGNGKIQVGMGGEKGFSLGPFFDGTQQRFI